MFGESGLLDDVEVPLGEVLGGISDAGHARSLELLALSF
jgi:hypothetical protein